MNTKPLILVADDNRSVVRLLEQVLQRQGYSVLTAYDGDGALEKASREKPDVVLLDVLMPGMDGYEVCRRLYARRDTPKIRVIFLTSRGRLDLPEVPELKRVIERNVAERAQAFDLGAVGFISKPVSAKEVVAEVCRVLALADLET